MIIRAKTFRAWFNANLKDRAHDIAAHGADAGYPCISYTADCCKIFDRFADEIWTMLADYPQELGNSPLELAASFRRADMAETWDTFRNLMVWFACETLAREIADKD